MNKYIDIANAAGNAKTVRATGVASVFVDKATTPDSPIIILYGNGSKWTVVLHPPQEMTVSAMLMLLLLERLLQILRGLIGEKFHQHLVKHLVSLF